MPVLADGTGIAFCSNVSPLTSDTMTNNSHRRAFHGVLLALVVVASAAPAIAAQSGRAELCARMFRHPPVRSMASLLPLKREDTVTVARSCGRMRRSSGSIDQRGGGTPRQLARAAGGLIGVQPARRARSHVTSVRADDSVPL